MSLEKNMNENYAKVINISKNSIISTLLNKAKVKPVTVLLY